MDAAGHWDAAEVDMALAYGVADEALAPFLMERALVHATLAAAGATILADHASMFPEAHSALIDKAAGR